MDNDANRRIVEHCYRTTSTMINPILDWSDSDVWEFLRHYDCQSNPLYHCGKNRIGCIGCPMQSSASQILELESRPKYKNLYLHAFEKMLKYWEEIGKPRRWKDAEEVMHWWVMQGTSESIEGQLSFFDE